MPNATVTYQAFDEVTLKPGFTALKGSNFTATVQPCPANKKAQNTFSDNSTQLISGSFENNEKKTLTINNIETEQFFAPVSKISLYPNPTEENLKVNIFLAQKKNIKLTLIDFLGREMLTITEEVDAKEYNIHLNRFASGLYYVRIEDEENILAFEKILVIK